jgi:hypothetical protein
MFDSIGYLCVWVIADLCRSENSQKQRQLCQSQLPIVDLLHRQQFLLGGCMRTSPGYRKCPARVSNVFQGGVWRARTIRLLSVEDSLSLWANWGAHAE